MARRSRKPFQLGLDPQVYNLQGIRQIDPEDLQREYRRMRREALDRLRGFARSAEYSTNKYYLQHKDMFNKRADQLSIKELQKLVVEGERFLLSERSSVSGQRAIIRRAVEAFREDGFTWVNTKNIKDFFKFRDWFAVRYKDKFEYVSTPKEVLDIYGRTVIKDRWTREQLQDNIATVMAQL